MTDILHNLNKVLKNRVSEDPKTSYTSALLHSGLDKCAEKFGEEAIELVIASISKDKNFTSNEAADVLYHFLVLLLAKKVSFDDVLKILENRFGVSGHEEKDSRSN